jgi:predicted nucleic acid-binding protein
MIVVDSNVIGYLYLPSEQSADAAAAFEKDSQWAAPRLWRSELRNVLTLYVRHRRMTLEEARETIEEAIGLLAGAEHEVISSQVLDLAAASGCSAYDCEFVALARELGVRLVTADKEVLKAFPDVAVALDKFAAA